MTGAAGKIPVRIETIEETDGSSGGVEVFVELGDFEAAGASFLTDMKEFKASYLKAVESARRADAPARASRRVGTRQRWAACKILADFNLAASNKFEIINYKEAYARDFGVPLRSVRTYLDFGSFSDEEVLDEVPFSLYAELAFRINALRRTGRLDAEKARLVEMARSESLPARDAYRRSLRNAPAG